MAMTIVELYKQYEKEYSDAKNEQNIYTPFKCGEIRKKYDYLFLKLFDMNLLSATKLISTLRYVGTDLETLLGKNVFKKDIKNLTKQYKENKKNADKRYSEGEKKCEVFYEKYKNMTPEEYFNYRNPQNPHRSRTFYFESVNEANNFLDKYRAKHIPAPKAYPMDIVFCINNGIDGCPWMTRPDKWAAFVRICLDMITWNQIKNEYDAVHFEKYELNKISNRKVNVAPSDTYILKEVLNET